MSREKIPHSSNRVTFLLVGALALTCAILFCVSYTGIPILVLGIILWAIFSFAIHSVNPLVWLAWYYVVTFIAVTLFLFFYSWYKRDEL
jgi:hypothetical protein